MDKRTRDALEASIKHWEDNQQLTAPNMMQVVGINCPLCNIFALADNRTCEGCPVAESTGESNCDGSPWHETFSRMAKWFNVPALDVKRREEHRLAFVAAAKKEHEFLISLRDNTDDEKTHEAPAPDRDDGSV